jgi:hypothetical protein
MAPGVQICLSFMLTFGVPLLIAAHELSALKRGGRGGSGGPRRKPGPLPVPPLPPPSQPEREPRLPPLPDCLIPVVNKDLVAERADKRRVLEPA